MQNEENFDQCNRKDKKEKIECSTYMLICSMKSDKKISETVSLKLDLSLMQNWWAQR